MALGDWLAQYDVDDLQIASAVSHSSLQIFHGAKAEGFRTLGITAGGRDVRYYDAFPKARPDRMLELERYSDLLDLAKELRQENTILVPHGSLVEYLGADKYQDLGLPLYGNRAVLGWESDRDKQREWLEGAGITMPRKIDDPRDIVEPVIVKYGGAKGGRGFFVCNNYQEFRRQVDPDQPYTIQEFVLGTRYYLHYFASPLTQEGYPAGAGNIQLLSIDRRDESNIDEANRIGSIQDMQEMGIQPSFVVTGNIPIVIRESLLPEVFRMGAGVVEEATRRFGGMWGPFCLETVVTPQLEFRVFEISARIVAGTNPFVAGSPYSEMIAPSLSTGRRIAQEIRQAAAAGRLHDILG